MLASSYLDRLLVAAAKRRALDEVALRAVFKATRLLGLALAQRLREYRDHGDPILDRFAQLTFAPLHLRVEARVPGKVPAELDEI